MARFNLDEYETVDARIDTFWAKHPDGAIHTQLVSDPNNFSKAVFKAEVFKQRPTQDVVWFPDAIGYAAEEQGTGGANNTSWHENAETSAIGRALANMGYATTKNRPSRQEMEKVERMESQPVSEQATYRPPAPAANERVPGGASRKQVGFIRKLAAEAGMDDLELHEFMQGETGKESSNDLSSQDASRLIERLQPLANNPRN